MIELVLKSGRSYDLLNISDFVYKLATCLHEDFGLNLGVFVAKCQSYGTIKVLKSLGLYKTIGKGKDKKVFIDEKLQFIINTTIADNETISKTIIRAVNGEYVGLKFGEINLVNYEKLQEFLIVNSLGNYSTYIIYNPDNQLYKIGRSKNVFVRHSQLKSEFSPKLELVAYLEKDVESELLFALRESNTFGEWFNVTESKINELIKKYSFKLYASIK